MLFSTFNGFWVTTQARKFSTQTAQEYGALDQVKDIVCQLEAYVEFFCPLRSERFKGVFNLSKETMPS